MTYSPQFETAFAELLPVEGGFTDDPRDPGNWTGGSVGVGECKGTKYGISAKAYPHLDIKNLTAEGAKAIYWNDYWNVVAGDQIPAYLASDVFDMCVNVGVHAAAVTLQRVAGVTVDGVVGPVTLSRLQLMDKPAVLKSLTVERIMYYSSLPGWPVYRRSWVDRTIGALVKALGV